MYIRILFECIILWRTVVKRTKSYPRTGEIQYLGLLSRLQKHNVICRYMSWEERGDEAEPDKVENPWAEPYMILGTR